MEAEEEDKLPGLGGSHLIKAKRIMKRDFSCTDGSIVLHGCIDPVFAYMPKQRQL